VLPFVEVVEIFAGDQGERDILDFDFFLFNQEEKKIQRAFEDVEFDPVPVFLRLSALGYGGFEGGRPRRLAQGTFLVGKFAIRRSEFFAFPSVEKLGGPFARTFDPRNPAPPGLRPSWLGRRAGL
jgi:hypothetical protein